MVFRIKKDDETFLQYVLRRAAEEDGRNIHATVTHVARSGMSRRIKFFIVENNEIRNITNLFDGNINSDGLLVRGCGMDMCFATLMDFYRGNMVPTPTSEEVIRMANNYRYID